VSFVECLYGDSPIFIFVISLIPAVNKHHCSIVGR